VLEHHRRLIPQPIKPRRIHAPFVSCPALPG
jgi:hypothetical protein